MQKREEILGIAVGFLLVDNYSVKNEVVKKLTSLY